MSLKTERTVGGHKSVFQSAYLMVMPAEIWVTNKVNVTTINAFVHRNLMVYTEN